VGCAQIRDGTSAEKAERCPFLPRPSNQFDAAIVDSSELKG
jgi:hypothetical protein